VAGARERAVAGLALAIPVVAGLGYLHAFGAPRTYLAVNAGAFGAALAWIALAPRAWPRALAVGLIALALAALFAPLLTGPTLSGVARWLPLGPFTLHAGMLVVPTLAVLVARRREHAPLLLSLALLAALLQPDMATGAALMLAGVGLYDATRDWKLGLFAIVAFCASIVAALRGELPAQPFVEHVIAELALNAPLAALALFAALLGGFFLILYGPVGERPARQALAGSLFGFAFAGLVSNYPSPLVGYGAAPILGYGLALGLLRASPADALRAPLEK
jgi:hypothetical protein